MGHDNSAKLRHWREAVRLAAMKALYEAGYLRALPLLPEGPVALAVAFYLERPLSVHPDRRPLPCVRHDLDKLMRAVGDALTRVIWKDDSQICYWSASKVYADADRAAGAHIRLTRLGLGPERQV